MTPHDDIQDHGDVDMSAWAMLPIFSVLAGLAFVLWLFS
jgi:hypothetical protein